MLRREFLHTSLAGALATLMASPNSGLAATPANLKLATFRFDVSPPMNHPLCGGWIKPVVGMDDPEEAIGFILTGAGDPIVICAVDWTGLLNEAHVKWRAVMAQAAGTTPERVAVQCVHQHNAPFVCPEADRIVMAQGDLPHVVFPDFFEQVLERAAKAVTQAKTELRSVTHIASGQAKVEKVAGNRRFVGPDGTIIDWRGSSSKNPKHHELPEGLIDPWLKTVAFYDGEIKLAACHYYACHPMSYYGDGMVSSDFVGLARKRRQAEDPDCTHIYFTGCSGNIAAGKYNNGTPEARVQLTDRIYTAIMASEAALSPQPIQSASWQTSPLLLTPRSNLTEASLMDLVANKDASLANRIRPAMSLGWLHRCLREEPIVLSALHINQTSLLHLPAESFLEYQLRAQAAAPDRFVATAAYGDGGPWYIPVAEAYPQGGYEVTVALTEPTSDGMITGKLKELV
ncbi:hypothetical protein GC163_14165 [bacterium]|nr:hypothetical protein [bacterium]